MLGLPPPTTARLIVNGVVLLFLSALLIVMLPLRHSPLRYTLLLSVTVTLTQAVLFTMDFVGWLKLRRKQGG